MIDGYLFKYLLRLHLNINYCMRKYIFIILINSLLLSQVSIDNLNQLSNAQIDILKEELKSNKQQEKIETNNIDNEIDVVSIQTPLNDIPEESQYFGYNYFNKEINFFDNIPTPSDFKLGPGDELILSLWGETNLREKLLINKNGMVYFDKIGFISLANKTIEEAESVLLNELSKIYSTLKEDSQLTKLMLELGKIKSINVYFTGNVHEPGLNLIHPFSDVFSALAQVGGVKNSGSLRQVKLIRNGNIIETIDFYSFFSSGLGQFQKVRIIEGDIIHIPSVKKRIFVDGEINQSKFYELLESDSLEDVIFYAGGLKPSASNKAILKNIIPRSSRTSDDNAKSGLLINLDNDKSSKLFNDGASISFLPIADNDNEVTVYGRVALPGKYPIERIVGSSGNQIIKENLSLKNILDLAGGFNDPIFRKSIYDEIVILRLDENNFYAQEFKIDFENSENFELKVNDKIFVYENQDYYRGLTFKIQGEVNKPGTYPLKKGLTINDAIKMSGGLTELGSIESISVTKNVESINEEGQVTSISRLVGNISLDFEIDNENIIQILPKTNVVRVSGNVYSPGFIAHNQKSMTMYKAIELAGGYKPYSMKNRAYVIRSNGEIEKANLFRGRTKRVFPGDSIFVPLDPNPDQFDLTTFLADLSTTLANIAAILVIADNN